MMPATHQATPLRGRPAGLKPATELAAQRPHGDRLRYMAGCRCDACRAANAAYERMRIAERKAGNADNIVPADKARAHLLALSAAGVGRKSVGQATDINQSILHKIRTGTRTQIRRSTERRILAVPVDAAMLSDGAHIDAGPSWALVAELVQAGFTKKRIAHELGQTSQGLQLGPKHITVRNADRLRRVHARLINSDERLVDSAESAKLIGELLDEGYLANRIAHEAGPNALALPRRITLAQAKAIADTHRRLTQ